MNNLPTPAGLWPCRAVLSLVLLVVAQVWAAPPPGIPGEEITAEDYFNTRMPADSINARVPLASPLAPTWLDKTSQTWEAPSLVQQIARDQKPLLLGTGAIFVPAMTSPEREPEVEVVDSTGEVVASGRTGEKISVLAGTYYVLIGSGAHKQKMVRTVTVNESATVPVLPDWSGLVIEVVDKNNFPFRGEYELARIDQFEALGRGYGDDPNLGEKAKPWIVSPGLYKIFGMGESYNTMTNFVTVRLLPGELVHYTLVQEDDNNMVIIGGGQVATATSRELLSSNWRYGIDFGGSVDFNAGTDHNRDSSDIYTSLALLVNSRLKYKKEKVEWETWLKLDESVDFSYDFTINTFSHLRSATDNMRLSSLFTWRFFPWLGPYGRLEAETELMPQYVRSISDSLHYFGLTNQDTVLQTIDSLRGAIRLQPAFSPFSLEAGLGANANMVNTHVMELRFLAGFGFKQSWVWEQAITVDSLNLPDDTAAYSAMERQYIGLKNKTTILQYPNGTTSPEYGPEASMYGVLRLGRWATAESELKLFAPVKRLITARRLNPDLRWRATMSWRMIRMVTLDYQYEYELRQPLHEPALYRNTSKHRVLLRFSITSR